MTEQPVKTWPPNYLQLVDYKARCFVNGTRAHGASGKNEPAAGEWSEAFLAHPWVVRSEAEGWGLELRTAVIAAVKQRIMADQPYDNIESLMPPKPWAQDRREFAKRAESSKQWRAKIVEEYGTLDSFLSRKKPRGRSKPISFDRAAFDALAKVRQAMAIQQAPDNIDPETGEVLP